LNKIYLKKIEKNTEKFGLTAVMGAVFCWNKLDF